MPLDGLGCTRTTVLLLDSMLDGMGNIRDCALECAHERGIASNRRLSRMRRMCHCSLYTPPVVIEDVVGNEGI